MDSTVSTNDILTLGTGYLRFGSRETWFLFVDDTSGPGGFRSRPSETGTSGRRVLEVTRGVPEVPL